MKTWNKALMLTVLLAAPFAVAQAHDDGAAHRAWLKAQQIDIKPTLTVKETEIPAGSAASSTGAPAGTNSTMPSSPSAPPSVTPSSSGTYSPGIQRSSPPSYPAPIENHPGMNSGTGGQAK
ncbi:MAG: hypothetical protein WBA83_17690 [Burkholderiaceae bacterium]